MAKDLKKESRGDYTVDKINLQSLQTGALMRIADATEVMSKNYQQLIDERNRYKRWYEEERRENKQLKNTNRGLRSSITRLKKKHGEA